MKKAVIGFLLTMTTVLAPAAQADGGNDFYAKLSPAEKLEHISSIRREVRELRSELSAVEGRYRGERLVFQIGDIGSTFSGWSAALVAILGNNAFNIKSPAGKAFWGFMAAFVVTEITEQYSREQVTVTEAEMARLKGDLQALEHRLEGFEAGYRTMSE